MRQLIFPLLLLFARCEPKKPMTEIDEFRHDFVTLEQDLWNTVIDEQANTISAKNAPEIDLIKSYKTFGDKLEKAFPHDLTHGVEPLEDLWIWARTYSELRSVYALYEAFRRFQKLQTDSQRVPSPKQAWIDLAETILTDSKSSIVDSMKKITDLVRNERIFQEAMKEAIFKPCEIKQPANLLLFHLYNAISLTQLKGYVMVQFASQLYKLFNMKGNFIEESQLSRHRFYEQSISISNDLKTVLNQTTRDFWRCDPKTHVKGETYTEITRLLQGYIENEIDMSPSQSCFKDCGYYDFAKNTGCYKNGYCNQQPKCRGKIMNCRYIDSDMWVCPSDRKSARRYEYIEYENGRILGRKMGCSRGTTKVDSWWRYLFWHCSFCMCLCDDDTNSERYFNLREYTSNSDDNKVVTGLRFVKKNKIIHLQIQEGELLPYGKINGENTRWKPIDEYKLTDSQIKEAVDFHSLSYENRDLDLDDLILEKNYLVTGVRFRLIGTHLNLEIRATPFNFTTGQLIQPKIKSFWHSSDTSPLKRKKLYLQVPDVPTRSYLPSQVDSTDDQYIEFTNSDFDRDAAQTTVPFIDTQDVVSRIAIPLQGAGIYHKGRPYFGGFVAPKIIAINYGQHVNVDFPPEIDFSLNIKNN